MNPQRKWMIAVSLVALTATVVLAQRRGGFRGFNTDRGGVPEWKNEAGFENDVFTFVRIQYDSGYGRGRGWGRSGGGWTTDFRDADLNLSHRLQQMTSLKVDPEGKTLRLTDPDLFNHPFIYIVEPGRMEFSDEEAKMLRRYLLSGGFLFVDDFWGDSQWENFYQEMKQVFPEQDREPRELEMDHPIFHGVFDLNRAKNDMQIPSIGGARWYAGETWESQWDGDTRTVHFKGYFDDKGRMMAFVAHNTDNGDGWEREGENEEYFREYSEKKAFPLAINVVYYAMTH
jgi:hypothetical protein